MTNLDNVIKQSALNEPLYIHLLQNPTSNSIAINEEVSVKQKVTGRHLIFGAFILSIFCYLFIFMHLYLLDHAVK